MKLFKKIIVAVISFAILLSSNFIMSACSCNSRGSTLRIYVPGEYISNTTLAEFEAWYLEKTGKTIRVEKAEFDTNETMYTQIAVKNEDFDIVCPSDYMVERMKKENLLQTLSTETATIVYNAVAGITEDDTTNKNENLINLIQNSFDPNMNYSSPYMWGTMGIMYYNADGNNTETNTNTSLITSKDAEKSTWKSLFKNTEQNIYMKDSERDTYTVALFNNYYNQLKTESSDFTNFEDAEYKALLNEIFVKGSNFNSKLNSAFSTLTTQKQYVYDYETDEGKDELKNSKGAAGYYGMFWSCDAGYIIAEYDEDGDPIYNENFRYIVPEEGSNVWIDAFCIPKYAGNSSAANLFIQFMTNSEVAFDCMDYAGCTSAIYQATIDYKDYLTSEEENPNFNATTDAFQSMFLSLMFPHMDITVGSYTINSPLNRCGVMRDLGQAANDSLSVKWADLRRD